MFSPNLICIRWHHPKPLFWSTQQSLKHWNLTRTENYVFNKEEIPCDTLKALDLSPRQVQFVTILNLKILSNFQALNDPFSWRKCTFISYIFQNLKLCQACRHLITFLSGFIKVDWYQVASPYTTFFLSHQQSLEHWNLVSAVKCTF